MLELRGILVYSKKSLEYFLTVDYLCTLLQTVLEARGYIFRL